MPELAVSLWPGSSGARGWQRLHVRGHAREAALLPEVSTVISLTAPHRSLSPLFPTLPTLTGGGGGSVQSKKTTGLHHWLADHHLARGNGGKHFSLFDMQNFSRSIRR